MNAAPPSRLHACLVLPLRFPEGLAPGHGRTGNCLALTVDGQGRPVLRGTALAGVLRHAFARSPDAALVETVFGTACNARDEDAGGQPSSLMVPDCPLVLPEGTTTGIRLHNAMDRDRGAVMEGRLFALEALPPGTMAHVVLWLELGSRALLEKVLSRLTHLVASGLTIGAAHARGIGRMTIHPQGATGRIYDLTTPNDLAAYLTDHRAWRCENTTPAGERMIACESTSDSWNLEVMLAIPRGQDLLVAADRDGGPQRVMTEQGPCWRVPGSTLRGLFRDWAIRLARRGEPHLAGVPPDEAVASLFGFVEDSHHKEWNDLPGACTQSKGQGNGNGKPRISAGRLHISDGFAVCRADPDEVLGRAGKPTDDVQNRTHVAVDRVSGGASDAALFDNQVLVSPDYTKPTTFTVSLSIREPKSYERVWLERYLLALHLGVIRVGSAKAAGRLAIRSVQPVQAVPWLAEHLVYEER